jgi:hypothetical protein
MTTKTETVSVKLYEKDVRSELFRMSSGYVGSQIYKILDKKFKSVYNSESRKKFFESDFKIVDNCDKEMVVFELVDNSTVYITPDYENKSLVFDFKVEGKEEELNSRLLSLRETVLYLVDTG